MLFQANANSAYQGMLCQIVKFFQVSKARLLVVAFCALLPLFGSAQGTIVEIDTVSKLASSQTDNTPTSNQFIDNYTLVKGTKAKTSKQYHKFSASKSDAGNKDHDSFSVQIQTYLAYLNRMLKLGS